MTKRQLEDLKNLIAIKRGYPDWETMENFIIDHNESHSEIVAQLLVSAMEEVVFRL